MRWLWWCRCLFPSLTTWVWSLGPPRWKERAESYRATQYGPHDANTSMPLYRIQELWGRGDFHLDCKGRPDSVWPNQKPPRQPLRGCVWSCESDAWDSMEPGRLEMQELDCLLRKDAGTKKLVLGRLHVVIGEGSGMASGGPHATCLRCNTWSYRVYCLFGLDLVQGSYSCILSFGNRDVYSVYWKYVIWFLVL